MCTNIPTSDELARPKLQVARRVLNQVERQVARMEATPSLSLDDGTKAADAAGWLACALLAAQGKSLDDADDLLVDEERKVQDDIKRGR